MILPGLELRPEELPLFFLRARYFFVLLFALFLFLLYKLRRPWVVVAGSAAFALYQLAVIQLPLSRPWGLGLLSDRLYNLGKYATAATGHSAFETYQVGAAELEPFWRLLMGLALRGEPGSAATGYDWLSAVLVVFLPVALYFGLVRYGPDLDREDSRWEAALIAFFVLLLVSSPLERFGVFQSVWLMIFLLKPNHGFGFLLLAGWARVWASDQRWVRALGGALFMSLLAWVFIMHWGYAGAGLLFYPILARALRREGGWPETLMTGIVSALAAAPYVLFLWRNHGWEQRGAELWDRSGYEAGYVDVFSPGWEHGLLFVLSVLGVVAMIRRKHRIDVLWLSLVCGTVPIWAFQFLLFGIDRAGEPDELYYYLRFLLTVAAGTGAFFAVKVVSGAKREGLARPICWLLALSLPFCLPAWWDPPSMDRYYAWSLEPLPAEWVRVGRWVEASTAEDAVFLGGDDAVIWIAGLAGRRAFVIRDRPPYDLATRLELEREILVGRSPAALARAQELYGLTHLVLDEDYRTGWGIDGEELETLPWIEPRYAEEGIRVYELIPSASTGRRSGKPVP